MIYTVSVYKAESLSILIPSSLLLQLENRVGGSDHACLTRKTRSQLKVIA